MAIAAQIRRLFNSSFTRSVGSMIVYTAIGQSVYLLSGPLIGRLYSPAEFGLYGLFFTFAVTAAGLIFLNYDFAIPAATSENDARELTRSAVVIALLLSPLAGLVMAALIIGRVTGFDGLPLTAALMLTVLLLAQGMVQLLQNWSIRRQQTIMIGKAAVTLNVVRGVGQVGLGAFFPSWWMLALGEVLGRIGSAAHLAKSGGLRFSQRRRLLFDLEARQILRRYRQFPLVLLPSQTADSIVIFVQSAGLAYLFGTSGLGMFFLMRRTLDIPVAFAFRSLSDVFYARLARDARSAPERVRPFFVSSVLLIAAAGFALGIPAMLISPDLFAFVFGAEWRQAGVLAAIMAPASIMNLAVAPVARVFALTARPYLRYWFSVVSLVGTMGSLAAVSLWSLDLVAATACLAATTFAAYVVYFVAGYIASGSLLDTTAVPGDREV